MQMRSIDLDGSRWNTKADFIAALKEAIGAPEWHGDGLDAFIDSMIWHDDINTLKSPYTIRIDGIASLPKALRSEIETWTHEINKAATNDLGTDLEINIQLA
jgi:hypothetical protein